MFDSTPNPLPLLLRRVIPPFLFFFFLFERRWKRNSRGKMDECVYEWWRARESRASGKRRNYVIPGRYARHATDSNPVKRSPFGLCIPYVLPLSHLSQREIPQPERACRRNRRVSAGACARAWNRETMKIPPISAYLEILSFPAFFPFSPPFFFLFFFS